MITIKGWNFGPADGRLVCRTLLPERHITRVVGGSDSQGVQKTVLTKSYEGGNAIVVGDTDGFGVGDFVYLGETIDPYSQVSRGRPYWPVDDVFYKGWGKIQDVNIKTKVITFKPHRFSIPKLPRDTIVIRSDHANTESFEFMDAEYTQWPMEGEAVANAGPFHMQHGSWRVEVEPIEKKGEDVFLHVMLPCDKRTLNESRTVLKKNVKLIRREDEIILELKGKSRTYIIIFKLDSPDAHITVTEGVRVLVDNNLTLTAIQSRQQK